ncbi:hypothetical protein [Sphingopyxis sp.]|uniref:hypothetical protein n=1 Tax=Sphingopyxis sp. TaxID=1908224 RepID=UPI002637E13B|nr:hypothetical protein [Sphingopyxis sp.]MCW0197876.1 hypothetical protein [Sphingopyxis sp.]
MKRGIRIMAGMGAGLAALLGAAALNAADGSEHAEAPVDIRDPWLKAWIAATPDNPPRPPVPGTDYGMNPDGSFRHPVATPLTNDAPAFPGELDHWDQNSYAKNVKVIAFYPAVTSPWHAWANIADFGGKRYLYAHDRDYLRILDVTDPRKAKTVWSQGGVWGPKGSSEDWDAAAVTDYFGGVTIAWNKKLQRNVLVASYEIGRFGLMEDKKREPGKVAEQRHYNSLKGFKVFVMDGPTPDKWKLIATRTTDYQHPDAPIGEQQGSGALDAVAWWGGKYMLLSAAPDDSYSATEYPDYLYSPGYQVWDMSDPADPKFVSQITVPGQRLGDKDSEAAYRANPRAGNRTSWMGSRTALLLTKPIEDGGKIGFGGMGGLGFYSFDLSDPANPKTLGHVTIPPSYAGTEFDNVDVSQYDRTGFVFGNGYPMNGNCYEPYKDIYSIDARDPAHPKIAARFPRPTPPKDADFTDYCQRRGSFGPKRSGGIGQPGQAEDRQGLAIYAFYTAGIQIFDVKDPAKPSIAGYFVPRFPTDAELPDYAKENSTFAVFTEYDRNIIWAFSVNGVYALSSPLLGKPNLGAPKAVWPARR